MSLKLTKFDDSTITVTLPSPKWGDEETVDDGLIPRKSRGGDPIAFVPSDAVRTRTFAFSIVAIRRTGSQDGVADLLDFLEVTAGLKIIATDAEERVITGFIVTDVADIITIDDDDPGSFDIHLEIMEDPE